MNPKTAQPRMPARLLRLHIRLVLSILLGAVVVAVSYAVDWRASTRLLAGWDAGCILYLALAARTMSRATVAEIRRRAAIQDEGAFIIPLLMAAAAIASLIAIVGVIGKTSSADAWEQLALGMLTIVLSWLLMHTIFALHYAHDYYRGAKPGGLQFPSGEKQDHADYWDFVYFSFVIGMTAQVSDVGITDKTIRRTATVHGIISFVYNTALVALMVNIAASAISG